MSCTSLRSGQIIQPDRKWLLFFVALIGKGLLIIILAGFNQTLHGIGPFHITGGDTSSYLLPIESLLRGEGYQPGYRMPGYGAIYWLLRLFASPSSALNALVALQWVADAASVVLLADLAWCITRSKRMHGTVYIVALVAVYVTSYDQRILTEAFTTFSLVAAFHQVVVFAIDGKSRNIVVAGLLLAWAGFMRPVYFPLLPLVALFLLFSRRKSLRIRIQHAVLFLLPVLVLDGAWVVRNYRVHHAFRPLSGSGKAISPDLMQGIKMPVMQLMQALGTNYVWWDTSSEIRWFNIRVGGPGNMDDNQSVFPNYIYTRDYNLDSLRLIRNDVALWYSTTDKATRTRYIATGEGPLTLSMNTPADAALNALAFSRITERCNRYRASFIAEKPFQYHIVAPLHLLGIFVLESGTASLMAQPWPQLPLWQKGIKLFYSALYLVAMLLGIAGAFVALFHQSFHGVLRSVPLALLYGVFVFPFLLRMCENRYLVVVYPLAIFFAAWLVLLLLNLLRKRGKEVSLS